MTELVESSISPRRHAPKIGAAPRGAHGVVHSEAGRVPLTLAPSDLAEEEWQRLGLAAPNWPTIREYRLGRIRHWLRIFDYAGILLYNPVNIRYATDTANMQVWCLHNPVRYCFIPTEGPVVLFEFKDCEHISRHLPLVAEIRPMTLWFFVGAGSHVAENAARWAAEIADLVFVHGGGNKRLAIDQCQAEGVEALKHLGVEICGGDAVMELARMVKHAEEIKAMRRTVAAVEAAMGVMREKLEPGISEMRLWSYLHAENIARGGEWIESRLLASGERTNPWYQECGNRMIRKGDLVAFDTDTIGPYGFCADISRTWLCGDAAPTEAQREVYRMAYEQVQYNQGLIKAGVGFRELSEKALRYPPGEFRAYTLLFHGVGLCDEYPTVFFPEHWEDLGNEGELEENMVLCVESYVGRISGGEGVKLEQQVRVTREGCENLTSFPFESALLR